MDSNISRENLAAVAERMMSSSHPTALYRWSKHCQRHDLYVSDRFAIRCFNGEIKIHRMSLIYCVGWSMIHDYPNKDAQISVFVTPNRRLNGLGEQLLRHVLTNYNGPVACADYEIAGPFFRKCYKNYYAQSA